MDMTPETIRVAEMLIRAALERIGATDVEKKVKLAIKFAMHQQPEALMLDGEAAFGVVVDIATVFTTEGDYRQIAYQGEIVTAEAVRALSIVLIGSDVHMCKCIYDVVPGHTYPQSVFVNVQCLTTGLDDLTEHYIC